MITNKYYIFGSKDSTDMDILIEHDNIPDDNNTAINICKDYKTHFGDTANINLITIENGIVINTITSKSTIDGVNNSLYHTYQYHVQKYPNPIHHIVDRNIVLNVYRCIRVVLSFLSRTSHRTEIKACLKGDLSFDDKLKCLYDINFTNIDTFNRKYSPDVNIWKTIPFYVGQTLSLLDGIEIYTKDDLIKYHPYFKNFIQRKNIGLLDKNVLNYYVHLLIDKIDKMNLVQTGYMLSDCKYNINMLTEK